MPSPDRWSVAECAGHSILSEDLFFELATVKVMQNPAQPDKRAPHRHANDKLIQRILSRDQKRQAPEPLKPTNKWPDPRAAAAELDAYQYLLLLFAHTKWHVAQINEVKSGQAYPAK